MVADVRQYGSEATNRGCKLASSSSSITASDVILIGAGGAAVGIVLFLVIARAYIASIP
ncbi:hypothetical protein [Deinococcus alpinitundrae]|uniref:hypothetical protein n=1 Tax=Deinococcus alpinitundrae TaxID=468913 RepID=UPI00137B3C69|nr:hypothetical protein [Deinococcus alpinitundrae]